MKALLILGFLVLQISQLSASNPEFTTVPQPANLVGDAIPGCIPLMSVVCFHNYGFGIPRIISEPHPFIGDAKEWQKKAWKLYLADMSEEGTAMFDDQEAKKLSRRCFDLAAIFLRTRDIIVGREEDKDESDD